jgi:hypothetical protein
MKDDGLEQMVLKGRLKLKFWAACEYYFMSFFLLIPFSFTLFSLFQIYVTNTYDGRRSAGDLIKVPLPFAIISILLFLYQRSKLKFVEVPIRVSQKEFDQIIKTIVDELQLEHVFHEDDLFQAQKERESSFKIPAFITVIWRADRILINSMNAPPKPSFPGTNKIHKRNVAVIRACIASVSKQSQLSL